MVDFKFNHLREHITKLIDGYSQHGTLVAHMMTVELTALLETMDMLEAKESMGEQKIEAAVKSENESLSDAANDDVPGHTYWTGIPNFDRVAWEKIKKEVQHGHSGNPIPSS